MPQDSASFQEYVKEELKDIKSTVRNHTKQIYIGYGVGYGIAIAFGWVLHSGMKIQLPISSETPPHQEVFADLRTAKILPGKINLSINN